MKAVHRVYFVGIGGIGMSALARYFLHLGHPVAGYDRTSTPLTQALEASGATVCYEDRFESIPDIFLEPTGTLVVYTPAVPANHAGLRYFQDNGYTVMKRSQVLGLIADASVCYAVAGTHGKTTTSCILAHLFKEAQLPFTAFLGGVSEDLGSNFWFSGAANTVVEADEYDRSFLQLHPQVACVTAMDADHLDIYGSDKALQESFRQFVGQVQEGGKLLVRKGLPLEGLTYGIEDGADYRAENIRLTATGYLFDLHTPDGLFVDVRFSKPGRHNLLNALAAFAMAAQSGASLPILLEALGSFRGVARRFSYQLRTDDLVFIDDYAHHPVEIDAVADALEEMYPDKEVLVVFQPHLFSRTRDFAQGFAQSLSRFDRVLLLDIYPARELPIPGIDAQWLLNQVRAPKKELVAKEELISKIRGNAPEVLVTLGAGDIGLEVEKIKQALQYEI